jgi:hypothetical protein
MFFFFDRKILLMLMKASFKLELSSKLKLHDTVSPFRPSEESEVGIGPVRNPDARTFFWIFQDVPRHALSSK